jgi:putative ABC transport system substrate-binding protein
VFAVAADPVALRLVASLNRPGGNATGVSFQFVELVPKQLGMLRELAPGASRIVALVRSNAALINTVVKDLQTSASVLGVPIESFRVGTGREIDAAFTNVVQKPGGAFYEPTCANRHTTRYPRSITRLNLQRSAD